MRRLSLDPWISHFLAWGVALAATLGALFIGEVMGQEPCNLCWFQRIFMFPLVAILLIALLRSDVNGWVYGLPLALLGVATSAWHTLQYAGIIPKALQPCSATGPSCSGDNMTIFAVVPIPLLAFISFCLIATLLVLSRRKPNR